MLDEGIRLLHGDRVIGRIDAQQDFPGPEYATRQEPRRYFDDRTGHFRTQDRLRNRPHDALAADRELLRDRLHLDRFDEQWLGVDILARRFLAHCRHQRGQDDRAGKDAENQQDALELARHQIALRDKRGPYFASFGTEKQTFVSRPSPLPKPFFVT